MTKRIKNSRRWVILDSRGRLVSLVWEYKGDAIDSVVSDHWNRRTAWKEMIAKGYECVRVEMVRV